VAPTDTGSSCPLGADGLAILASKRGNPLLRLQRIRDSALLSREDTMQADGRGWPVRLVEYQTGGPVR
jgi:hypothetical protein